MSSKITKNNIKNTTNKINKLNKDINSLIKSAAIIKNINTEYKNIIRTSKNGRIIGLNNLKKLKTNLINKRNKQIKELDVPVKLTRQKAQKF